MTVPFDRIFSSSPLNKTASAVTAKGESYEPAIKTARRHWDAPPALKKLPPNTPDLTGLRKGRLTVLGLLDETRQHKAAWVVRCVCGTYETRTAKALRNEANSDDKCQFCAHTQRLRERGSQPRSVDEFLADNGIKTEGGR